MPTLVIYLQEVTEGAPARRRCRMTAGAAALTAVLPLSVPLGGCWPAPEALGCLRIACRRSGYGRPRRGRDQFGAAESRHRRPAGKGTAMAITDIIIVAAIFIMGAAAGLVAVVSIGVRHEELLFREERRYREEERRYRDAQGDWPGRPDGPSQFFSAEPPSLVCHGARALTGLWIRRERGADPLAIPRYERRH